MAKRESQGMQIAVILLVMFCLLFIITTIIFWNNAKKLNAEVAQLRTSQQQMTGEVGRISDENQQLKTWLGFAPDEGIEAITPAVKTALSVFGPTYPEAQRNFRELPTFLMKTVQDQHQRLNTASNLEKQLEGERNQAREQERRDVKVAEDNHQKAAQDLATENEKFAKEVAGLRQQVDKRDAEHKKTQTALNQQIASLNAQIRDLQDSVGTYEQLNRRLGRQLKEFKDDTFERPSGRITWVHQSLRTAYVDLGRADGVRPSMTFSVYDVDENNVATADKKGSIEITRILGDHLAEARILDDRSGNPIIPGDVIYSPIFQPGSPIRFALAGFMDIDGDGVSDRELIRNLIAINGGVIDAEVDDAGQTSGKITIETRYLVVGSEATEKTSAELREAQGKMMDEADRANVTIIGLSEFLGKLGYAPSAITVRYDADSQPEALRPEQLRNQRFRGVSNPSATSP